MAFKTSEKYKSVIYSGDCRHKFKLLFNGVELADADVYCESLKVTSRILPNGSTRFSLDNFIAKEAEIILHDIDTTIIQSPVNISIGTLVDGTYEYVPIGLFVVQDLPTTDKNKTTIKLRDYAVKFDFGYNAKDIIDENGGSATLLQVLQDICSKAGVETDITKFYGSNSKIGIYDNTITGRTYISYLAEQAGAIATIDRSGKLIFVQLKDLETVEIPLNIVEKYEDGEKYEISRVVYEDAIRKFEYGDESKDTLFINTANPYINNEVLINTLAGTKIETADSSDNEVVNYKQYGYTKQNVYSGKNLLNLEEFKTQTTNGITVTKNNDGTITLNGTSTEATFLNLNNDKNLIPITQGDIISIGVNNILPTSPTGMYVELRQYGGTGNSFAITRGQSEKVNQIANYTDNCFMFVYIPSGMTFNNFVIFPMVVKASSLGNYEPYVGGKASPSPDYPQEIEVGRGKNLLGLVDGSYTNNGITAIVENGKITINGTANDISFIGIPIKSEINFSNKNHTISMNNSSIISDSLTEFRLYTSGSEYSSVTFTTIGNKKTLSNDNTYTKCQLRTTSDVTYNNFVIYPQLEKGSVATSYLPYNTIESKSTGKNLLKGLSTSLTDGEYWFDVNKNYFTPLEDGWGKFEYDNTNGTSTQFINAKVKLNAINLKENTSYTILTEIRNSNISENTGALFQIVTSNPTIAFAGAKTLEHKDINNGGKFITVSKTKESFDGVNVGVDSYLRLPAGTKGAVEARITLIEGNYANENLDYEPYKESLITYNLGDNFLADKDYIENGVLNKNIRHLRLAVADMNNTNGYPGWRNISELYSDYPGQNTNFGNVTNAWINIDGENTKKLGINTMGNDPVGTIWLQPAFFGLTQTQWKEQYPDLVVDIYYEMPQTEQIPLETTGELRTFEPNTIITNDLSSEMEVEYKMNQTRVSQILELNKNIPLNSFKTGKIIGNPAIDAYDIIKIIDGGKEFKTLATNDLTYNGVMINTFDTQIGKEAKKENVTLTPEATFKKWAKTEIDNVEAEVRINAGKIETVVDEMGNMYTKGQVNDLIANAETGVTNTFSEAGGNNEFRNTGLWFANSGEDAETNPYEFWEGKANEGSNDKATNYRSILLGKGSFTQDSKVPNGNYSISFYYRKLIASAIASVVINGKEYPLDSLEEKQFYTGEQNSETGEYIVDPVVVTNNHIKIEFKCDALDGVEVYDLMCNKGSIKLAYSQNQNETTTDTVNISKGITITSSADENTKFKAGYDGIRVVDKSGNIKTKFTDKGTETDELLVRKKATITGLLHQEVDDQTWVTKI